MPPLDTSNRSTQAPWWARLHTALMPDYNRPAAGFWWCMVLLGAAAVLGSLVQVAQEPPSVWLQVAAGMAIAMAAGFFPVRIPHVKNSFAAGEIFIFLLLLMHGPAAATLAAAGEAAVGSWRTSKRWTSRIASPAMSGTAMFAVGSALSLLLGGPDGRLFGNAGLLVVASMAFALAYFLLNTTFVTTVGRLKRGERFDWHSLFGMFGMFGWVGIAYAGSAAVAALLFLVYRQSGIGVLMGMLPLLAMLLATLHYFFRQQEAAEAVRQAGAEAAARHAELAAQHMRALEASERRFHSAFTHASIGMALLSFEGRVLQANAALRSLLGRREGELAQHAFDEFVHEDDRGELALQLRRIAATGKEAFALELRCRHLLGHEVWVATHCSFFSEPDASAPCLILQVQDISARRKAEQGLHHLAFHDSLTGLPNRRRFHELLTQAVQRAQDDREAAFAVMFLDFDRFKLINDSLGHDAGDLFLVQVAERLQQGLRAGDVVARLGGDEFALLVLGMPSERGVVALAERMMEALKQPFQVAGTELMTSASIGITFSAFGYRTPEEVLRDADTAMYKAKGAGKARYALFDSSLHTEVANRLRLEGDLRRAIDEGQLGVAFQPVYDLHDGRLAGFEALVRWRHPADGSISPGAFLPIAEEAGLMLRLTDFVLNCACRQLRVWQQAGPEWAELTINVNVSGHDVSHPAFAARVSRAIVEAGLQARHLTLELTENILMARLEGALPALAGLRQLGVGLAVDDFGTGYSSLAHLATLPIDVLKIDRSFVHRLEVDSNEAAVVRSIVLLGSSLGKSIVAEGIETESQLEQLRALGCRYGQGYLLGRPLAASETDPRLLGVIAGTIWRPASGAETASAPTAPRTATMLH